MAEVPDTEHDNIDSLRISRVYQENRERYFETHGINEHEWHEQLIDVIEKHSGPLLSWQKFYVIAAISGRGVEWAQTRGRTHYHIVGLPCSVCGRR